MTVNAIAISRRTLPFDQTITAGGSFTLPQYAFIPNPSVQPLSSGFVGGPTAPELSANFVLAPQFASRPYPVPSMPSVYGLRAVQLKSSPG